MSAARLDEALAADPRGRSRRWARSARRWPTAAGRVAAEDARGAVDLPPFDRSAMDGYAVRAADTAPGVALRLAGGVAAGEVSADGARPRHGGGDLHRRGPAPGRRRGPAVRAGDAWATAR